MSSEKGTYELTGPLRRSVWGPSGGQGEAPLRQMEEEEKQRQERLAEGHAGKV